MIDQNLPMFMRFYFINNLLKDSVLSWQPLLSWKERVSLDEIFYHDSVIKENLIKCTCVYIVKF